MGNSQLQQSHFNAWIYTVDVLTIYGKRIRFFSASVSDGIEDPAHPTEYAGYLGETLRDHGCIMLMGAAPENIEEVDLEIEGVRYVNIELQGSGVLSIHCHSPFAVAMDLDPEDEISVNGEIITKSMIN